MSMTIKQLEAAERDAWNRYEYAKDRWQEAAAALRTARDREKIRAEVIAELKAGWHGEERLPELRPQTGRWQPLPTLRPTTTVLAPAPKPRSEPEPEPVNNCSHEYGHLWVYIRSNGCENLFRCRHCGEESLR